MIVKPVLSKRDFVRRYAAGEFGNASSTWRGKVNDRNNDDKLLELLDKLCAEPDRYLSDLDVKKLCALHDPTGCCRGCFFWEEVEEPSIYHGSLFWPGRCTRYPPIAVDFGPQLNFGQPESEYNNSCGEWTEVSPWELESE